MKESWYLRRILPYLIDFAGSLEPMLRKRREVVPLVFGRALEIGFGTGLNMAYYDGSSVREVFGLEPYSHLPGKTRERVAGSGITFRSVPASAEDIPFEDGTFDSAVMTYTLCSIPHPLEALREIRRILKPGGKLYYCEHGLAPEACVRRCQNALDPFWNRISGGCHLNRNVPALLQEAAFDTAGMRSAYISSLRFVSYNYWGEAGKILVW